MRPAGEQFAPPPDWQQHFKTDAAGFDDVDLADILAAFGRSEHGGRPHQNAPRPGQDYEVQAKVSLEQVFQGAVIEVRAELPEFDTHGLAHRVARTFHITIPKGTADGQRLRLAGKGGGGFRGGRSGDLYIALSFLPHPLFRPNGRDLYLDLPLTPWEAVLGAAVEIPTLAGPVELNIKAGCVSGQKLRLAKRGLLSPDGSAGALYAILRIDVPTLLSPHERSLFEQLAASSKFNPRQHFVTGAKS